MKAIKSETDFLRQMIVHHQDALVMARQVLELKPSEPVRKLAEGILSTQTDEITTMRRLAGGSGDRAERIRRAAGQQTRMRM